MAQFQLWKEHAGRDYESSEEHSERQGIWSKNVKLIHEHNQQNKSYSLAINHLGDLVSFQFNQSESCIDVTWYSVNNHNVIFKAFVLLRVAPFNTTFTKSYLNNDKYNIDICFVGYCLLLIKPRYFIQLYLVTFIFRLMMNTRICC